MYSSQLLWTVLLKNLAYHGVRQGHSARFICASDMLGNLADQEFSAALARRLRRYITLQILCVDEVRYLSYSSRYGDCLFDVVNRQY